MLTIGSDPEFMIYKKNGSLCPANRILASDMPKRIGTDGCSTLGELRPLQSSNPLIHAKNTGVLIKEVSRIVSQRSTEPLILTSCPMGGEQGEYSTGGHIHLGGKEILEWKRSDYVISKLMRSMDIFVGIPLLFIENKDESYYRRGRKGYGRLNSHRDQRWGVEWRVPNSWLGDKALAQGVLSLAYVAASNAITSELGLNLVDKVTQRFNFEDIIKCHALADTGTEMKILRDDAIEKIKTMELYPKYKKHVDYILDAAREHRCLYTSNINAGWNIRITIRIYKHDPLAFAQRVFRQIGKRNGENSIISFPRNEYFMISHYVESVGGAIDFVINKWVRKSSNAIRISAMALAREDGDRYGYVVSGPNKQACSHLAEFLGRTLHALRYNNFYIAMKVSPEYALGLKLSYKMRKRDPIVNVILIVGIYLAANNESWKPLELGKWIDLVQREYALMKKRDALTRLPFLTEEDYVQSRSLQDIMNEINRRLV